MGLTPPAGRETGAISKEQASAVAENAFCAEVRLQPEAWASLAVGFRRLHRALEHYASVTDAVESQAEAMASQQRSGGR